MDILSLIQSRRSVREFQKKSIPRDILKSIVDAGIWAPSGMNSQPWRFVVVDKPEHLKIVAHEAAVELARYLQTPEAQKKYGKENCERFMPRAEGEDEIFYSAPAIVFVVNTVPSNLHFDHGLATQNILLAAHSQGIGSCCIGLAEPLNNSSKVRKLFGMKAEEQLVIGVVLGYPAEKPEPTKRKLDVVKWVE